MRTVSILPILNHFSNNIKTLVGFCFGLWPPVVTQWLLRAFNWQEEKATERTKRRNKAEAGGRAVLSWRKYRIKRKELTEKTNGSH